MILPLQKKASVNFLFAVTMKVWPPDGAEKNQSLYIKDGCTTMPSPTDWWTFEASSWLTHLLNPDVTYTGNTAVLSIISSASLRHTLFYLHFWPSETIFYKFHVAFNKTEAINSEKCSLRSEITEAKCCFTLDFCMLELNICTPDESPPTGYKKECRFKI